MSSAVFVVHSYGDALRIKPDPKGCVVSTDGVIDGAIILTPNQMRSVAFELLAVARDRDGKDWVEELDRVAGSRV